jgi:hypothetical protein
MITVTASTSVVLVATSVNAPTDHVVLFPQLSNIGRLITVRDNDGQASLTNPIVMSTMTGTTFTTGNQININQPFGFVTVTTQTPTTYSILNTFAFPAEQSAANIQTLNAQTINVSTIQLLDTTTNLPVGIYSSTNQLIYNNQYVGDITNEELQSTVVALGTIGYLSTIPDYFPIPPVWVAVGISSNNAPSPSAIGTPQGTIQYSTDSIVWKNAANNGGFSQYGTAATFDGKGMFIAVGANRSVEGSNLGYIQWSYNGSNWQTSASPYLSTSQERTDVLYANGLYHATGYTPNGGPNTILWSSDGKSWNPSQGNPFSSPSGALGFANGIAYGAGVWVCAGSQDASSAQSSLLWSSDGSNWNPATTASWTGNEVYDVAYNGTTFIALTKDGLNPSATNIAKSTDGKNWVSAGITGGNFGNLTKYVAGNELEWLVTTNDTNKSLVYSLNDGTTWNTNANIATCNVNMYRPYFDGSKWLMGVQTPTTQSIYYSGDAVNWTTATIQSQFINGGYARGFASSDGLSNVNLLLASTMSGLANNFTTSTLAANTISTSIITADTIYSALAFVSTVFIGTTIVSTTYETINNISTQNVDFISAGVMRAYDVTIENLKVDITSTSYATISTLDVQTISSGVLYAGQATIDDLSTRFLSTSQGTLSSLFVNYISSGRAFINDLQVNALNASSISFTTGSISNLNVQNLSTSQGIISSLFTNYVSTNQINANSISTYSLTVYGPNTFTNEGSTILTGPIVGTNNNISFVSVNTAFVSTNLINNMQITKAGNSYSLSYMGHNTGTGYAFRQDQNGSTYVNCAGGGIEIRQNDKQMAYFDSTNSNLSVNGVIYAQSQELTQNSSYGNLKLYGGTENGIFIRDGSTTSPAQYTGYYIGNSLGVGGTVDKLVLSRFNNGGYTPGQIISMTTTGNVGVGTNSPSAKLDVQGDVNVSGLTNVSGDLYVGSGFYTIADGNVFYIGHSNLATTNTVNYAVAQEQNGATFINSKAGQNITFAVNNTTMGYFEGSTSNLVVNGSIRINENGSTAAPSISWPSDTDSGFYHAGDADIRTSINGIDRLQISTPGIIVNGAIQANDDFYWGGLGVPVPGLLKYIPIAWLANGSIVSQSIFCSWPMCYTGASGYINLPNGFSEADDGVQIGPRVRVQLYDIISPTTETPKYDLTNSSYTSWSFEATPDPNKIKSYRAFFF